MQRRTTPGFPCDPNNVVLLPVTMLVVVMVMVVTMLMVVRVQLLTEKKVTWRILMLLVL